MSVAGRVLVVGALIGLGWVTWDRASSTSSTAPPPATETSSHRAEETLSNAEMKVTENAQERCLTVTVEGEPAHATCYRIANFGRSAGLFLLSEPAMSTRNIRAFVVARLDSVDIVDVTLDGDVAVRQIDHFVLLAGSIEELPRAVITIRRDGVEAHCRFKPAVPLPQMLCTP